MFDKSKIIMPSDEEDKQIRKAAQADPEAQPLTKQQLNQMKPAIAVHPQLFSLSARVRHKLNISQGAFAKLLGVPLGTIQAWEQGRREPGAAAISLLKIAENRPDVLKEVLL